MVGPAPQCSLSQRASKVEGPSFSRATRPWHCSGQLATSAPAAPVFSAHPGPAPQPQRGRAGLLPPPDPSEPALHPQPPSQTQEGLKLDVGADGAGETHGKLFPKWDSTHPKKPRGPGCQPHWARSWHQRDWIAPRGPSVSAVSVHWDFLSASDSPLATQDPWVHPCFPWTPGTGLAGTSVQKGGCPGGRG